VNKPCCVCGAERICSLRNQVERPLRLQATRAEQLPKIGSFDVRHREVEDTVMFAGSDRGNDVGVVEARRELRFAHETLAEAFVTG